MCVCAETRARITLTCDMPGPTHSNSRARRSHIILHCDVLRQQYISYTIAFCLLLLRCECNRSATGCRTRSHRKTKRIHYCLSWVGFGFDPTRARFAVQKREIRCWTLQPTDNASSGNSNIASLRRVHLNAFSHPESSDEASPSLLCSCVCVCVMHTRK